MPIGDLTTGEFVVTLLLGYATIKAVCTTYLSAKTIGAARAARTAAAVDRHQEASDEPEGCAAVSSLTDARAAFGRTLAQDHKHPLFTAGTFRHVCCAECIENVRRIGGNVARAEAFDKQYEISQPSFGVQFYNPHRVADVEGVGSAGPAQPDGLDEPGSDGDGDGQAVEAEPKPLRQDGPAPYNLRKRTIPMQYISIPTSRGTCSCTTFKRYPGQTDKTRCGECGGQEEHGMW